MKKLLFLIGFLVGGATIANAASVFFPYQGGTGTSTVPTSGYVLVGQSNGTYAPQATSTLGLGGGGSGTVTSITAGTGLTGGTITTSGTIALSSPVSIANGGTGSTTANTAFNSLSPLTTLGDILYGGSSGVGTRLGGNTATTTFYLSQVGDGTNSAAPSWQAVPVAGSKFYYMYATQATSSSAFFNMNSVASTTSTTVPYVLTASTQFVQNWISPTGTPDVTVIPAGSYTLDLFAWRSSGSASITLYAEIWEVSSTGADISLIGTTNTTPNLTNSKAQYNITVTASQHTMSSTASRILVRLYATAAGTPTLSLAMGDGDPTDLFTPGITVDTTNFVPYTGATANLNLGSLDFLTTGSLGSTGSRLLKAWLTDLTVTNTISGSITGNAATVTTNANLTGPITSSGNATAIASQTGTGTKFVVDTSPTLVTPILGVASSTALSVSGNLYVTGTSTLATTTITRLGVSSSAPTNSISVGSGAISVAENTVATSTTQTINWTEGNQQLMRIGTAAISVTFASSTPGQKLTLVVCNAPAGTAGALTFSSAVTWANHTTPTQTTTANNCDVWSFLSTNATSTQRYFGTMSPNF